MTSVVLDNFSKFCKHFRARSNQQEQDDDDDDDDQSLVISSSGTVARRTRDGLQRAVRYEPVQVNDEKATERK